MFKERMSYSGGAVSLCGQRTQIEKQLHTRKSDMAVDRCPHDPVWLCVQPAKY